MKDVFVQKGFSIREAHAGDIESLVKHHSKMFEEIWKLKGLDYDISRSEKMDQTYTKKLKKELGKGKFKAWVVEDNCNIIAMFLWRFSCYNGDCSVRMTQINALPLRDYGKWECLQWKAVPVF